MKRILASLAVLSAVALAVPTHAAEEAKALYTKKCAACHGPDGKGQTKMGEKLGAHDLNKSTQDAAAMGKTIENGQGKMPPVKGLTKEEVAAVAKFVKGGLK